MRNRFEEYMSDLPPKFKDMGGGSLTAEQRMEKKLNKKRRTKETRELERKERLNAVTDLDSFKTVVWEAVETDKLNGGDTKATKRLYCKEFPVYCHEAKQDIKWMNAIADDMELEMPYDASERTVIALG